MEISDANKQSKLSNLVIFSLMFIAEMTLIISKLEYVSVFAFGRMENPGFGNVKIWYPPRLDAQIFAGLMIVLALGCSFFLVQLVRANKFQQ